MTEDTVRILRIVEYTGPRSAVERHFINVLHGEKRQTDGVVIKAATLGQFPEILESSVS